MVKQIIRADADGKKLDASIQEFRDQLSPSKGGAASAHGRSLAFVDSVESARRAREVLFGLLPSSWDATCKLEDSLVLVGCHLGLRYCLSGSYFT